MGILFSRSSLSFQPNLSSFAWDDSLSRFARNESLSRFARYGVSVTVLKRDYGLCGWNWGPSHGFNQSVFEHFNFDW